MKQRQSERGVALIICLFALMLLSGIGLGMMYMADTETAINRNYRDSQQAYFASVAGLQEVRERLMPTSATAFTAAQRPSTLPGIATATGVMYVLNYTSAIPKTSIVPWDSSNTYFDKEFCKENFVNSAGTAPLVSDPGSFQPCSAFPTGTPTTVDSNSPFVGADNNLAYRWIRVTLKANNTATPYYVTSSASANTVPICWDGFRQKPKPASYTTCDDDPPAGTNPYLKSVYVLTSLALAPGGSRRMTQMEVANDPPFITNAALDTDDFVTVSGASVTVNGYDNCKCSCTTAVGAAAPTCTDRTTGAPCTGSTYAIYSSQDVSTSGGPALIAGTSPPVAENQTFPYDVSALIAKYSSKPGVVNVTGSPYNLTCTAQTGSYKNCGTLNNGTIGTLPNPFPPVNPNNPAGMVSQITYVPGSVDIQAHTTGAGILVVDGDLTIHGGLEFYGLIIVRGVLTFSGSGTGQDVNVAGAMLAGQGSVADTLSGGINIQFDRCALAHDANPAPPALLATRELTY